MTKKLSSCYTAMSLNDKLIEDTAEIIDFVCKHPQKQGILALFKKGPPQDMGFMWCDDKSSYWSDDEACGLRVIQEVVWKRGWESSGFGIMMRNLQHEINNLPQ